MGKSFKDKKKYNSQFESVKPRAVLPPVKKFENKKYKARFPEDWERMQEDE